MKVNDTVYYWENHLLEEATIFMFGGRKQVVLDIGDSWLLKQTDEVIHIKDMTEEDWKFVNL
jgi:hypothetical protein